MFMAVKEGKIVIVGAGHVGSAALQALAGENLAREIVVIDVKREQARGEAQDAGDTQALSPGAGCEVRAGGYEECADAQIIVIAAGEASEPDGDKDRMALLEGNVKVIASVMEEITHYTREAIIVNLTNPVDVLTYFAVKKYGYPRERLFSTGTLLDTGRMARLLGRTLGVDPQSISGLVLGEHGKTAFIPWNTVSVSGVPLERFEEQFGLSRPVDREELIRAVKDSGAEIISGKGYSAAGISQAVCRVVSAILFDTHTVFPLCIAAKGEYGLERVAMSLPCVLGKKGVERVLTLPLMEEGERAMRASDEYLRSVIADIDFDALTVAPSGYLGGFPPQHTNPACIGRPVS